MPFEKPCPFVKKDKKMMLLLLLFAKACVQNINVLFNNETNKQKVVSHCVCVCVSKYVGSRNQKLQNRTLVG